MNCSSEEEFYLKYKRALVPLLLYRNDIKSFEEIASKLNMTNANLIKVIFTPFVLI